MCEILPLIFYCKRIKNLRLWPGREGKIQTEHVHSDSCLHEEDLCLRGAQREDHNPSFNVPFTSHVSALLDVVSQD